MLHHPVDQQLQYLNLTGMVRALSEQREQSTLSELSFEERLSFLLDREISLRDTRRLKTRLQKAKLKHAACMEDIDYTSRHLDKALIARLAQSQWISAHQNVFVTGPTGTGKTYLACALAHKACLEGYRSSYHTVKLWRINAQAWEGTDRGILITARHINIIKKRACQRSIKHEQKKYFQNKAVVNKTLSFGCHNA